MTLSGPSDVWFGVGFNASTMGDLPYAVIVDGQGNVQERKMGDHVIGKIKKRRKQTFCFGGSCDRGNIWNVLLWGIM